MILPYPISTNRYWRTFRGITTVSREAKAYKAEVARIAQASGCLKLSGDVGIHITLYPKANQDGSANKRVLDLDNCLKVVLDALQGVAYDNDRQVKQIVAQYGKTPRKDGAVLVFVKPLQAG